MKPFTFGVFVVAAALCVANVFAADEPASTKDSKDEEGVKIYKRLIPADVLRGGSHTKTHTYRMMLLHNPTQ